MPGKLTRDPIEPTEYELFAQAREVLLPDGQWHQIEMIGTPCRLHFKAVETIRTGFHTSTVVLTAPISSVLAYRS